MVHSLDDFWHRKYAETKEGELMPVVAGGAADLAVGHGRGGAHGDEEGGGHGDGEDGHGHGIHMPSPSYWPIVSALGLPVLGYGLLYSPILVIDGALILLGGLYAWALEPSAEPAGDEDEG